MCLQYVRCNSCHSLRSLCLTSVYVWNCTVSWSSLYSEDSDGEGGLGNVNRVVIRPPGTSGKAKRGHLCFDASFETGNLGKVELISEYEYDLFIRPDTCSPRFRLWFNFTVDNCRQDQRVIFNIVNISKTKNLFRDGMTPLVKSSSRPKWQRLPKKNVFHHRSVVHQGHHVLSFAFAFDREDEVFQFTLAAPYSYSRLQAHLGALENKTSPGILTREVLAESVQNRRLDLITFAGAQNDANNKCHVVVILARVHPGEAPSSFVCQGLLEFLASSHPAANILRDNSVVFKVVPMLNPDGVFLGNSRSTLMGFDLNRSWHIASQWAHPTLKAVIDMLAGIEETKDSQLDFVIDIHAHSSLKGSFIYGNTYEDVYRYERHLVFPKLLATLTDDFAQNSTMYNSDNNKVGTSRRFLCNFLNDSVNCYTLEVSLFGYQPQGIAFTIPYTEDSYMRLGRNLARTFVEYYKTNGVIPALPDPTDPFARSRRSRTHQRRSRTRSRHSSKPRSGCVRDYAPLHRTDLIDLYDSSTSNEVSPVRNHSAYKAFGIHRNFILNDPVTNFGFKKHKSMFDFSEKGNFLRKIGGGATIMIPSRTLPHPQTFTLAPQPCLTIIDFNKLTRGGLDQAVSKNVSQRNKSPQRRQKRKSPRRSIGNLAI